MAGNNGSSNNIGALEPYERSLSDQLSSSEEKPQALAGVLDFSNFQERSNSRSTASSIAVSDGSSFPGALLPGTPPRRGSSSSSVRTTESKIDEIYERQIQVHQVAEAQVHGVMAFNLHYLLEELVEPLESFLFANSVFPPPEKNETCFIPNVHLITFCSRAGIGRSESPLTAAYKIRFAPSCPYFASVDNNLDLTSTSPTPPRSLAVG